MPSYTNVYAGKDAIQVLPWILASVELHPEETVPYADGDFLSVSLSSNETASPRLAYAIPAGFITGTFMELDLFDNGEIAKFCERWGAVAAPYAGSIARMTARLVNAGTEEGLLNSTYESNEDEMPERSRIDCYEYGSAIWYEGLYDSGRDAIYKDWLGGSNWMEAFNRDTTSKGSEVINAQHFADGGADNCALIYVEEVRLALAIMRIAVLINGFYEKAGHNISRTFKLAVKCDDLNEAKYGGRPFEDALALFMNTDFLHPDIADYEDMDWFYEKRGPFLSQLFNVIEQNTMLFADLCLSSTPEPMVVHGGFRRGELAGVKMPDAGNNLRYGNLLHAMAAQLYAYLNDGNPWAICEVCGRPFKYEQQKMAPIISVSEAQKVYGCRHRPTKTAFCSKRHEKKVYGLRNAENKKLKKKLKSIRSEA